METVTDYGRETAYRLSDRGGSGPTILCVHGSGGNHGVWKSQARLSDRFPVAALDLSGHGRSDDVDADPGFDALSAYADDVLAVAAAVDADVLVGSSLGGAVVLHTAIERADDHELSGLILAGTGPRLPVLDDVLDWLDDDFDRVVEFLHEPGRFFSDPDERMIEFSEQAMRECGREVVRRDFLTCHRFDVRDQLDEVSIPTRAVVGEHDRLTPPWYHETLAEEIPDCELTVLDDAAHLAMLDRPDAFNRTVESFVEALD